MRRLGFVVLLPILLLPVAGGCGTEPPGLKLNDIQVLASHNSYHREPEPALLDALRGIRPDVAVGIEYTHLTLPEEFDKGVRQVELDVFVDDPAGGRYAAPKLVPILGLEPVDPRMSEPGLKVFHIQEIDYRSSCPTFVSCLEHIRDWSDAHPNHTPITIQIEAKDGAIDDPGLGFVIPIPWDDVAPFAQLEQEILSVFEPSQLVTPAEVKGSYPSLKDAVLADNWPTLADTRGKVLFTLDDAGTKRDLYRDLHPDVEDRLVFVSARPPEPDAAFTVINDPIAQAGLIGDLAEQGFIVRTRADENTIQARNGDTTMREAAWASGAHYVSTDYIVPDPRFTNYSVSLPGGGVARCNASSFPDPCNFWP